MDAGLAAVLGALAGAVATTGAAFATGWSTREQAKMAARAEHRRQRRDARQAVYEEFINAIESMTELATTVHEDIHEECLFLVPGTDEALSRNEAISKLATKAMLAGPTLISELAQELRSHAGNLTSSLIRIEIYSQDGQRDPDRVRDNWTRVEEYRVALEEGVATFAKFAQEVLDDDGTLP
ncbi:hypothetical protein [Streptomyces sp. V4I2]|uniref:hypothetical protein n=1 Tax=Streptomyces sp. V4I2 TaxID=3042280 RepID=UPI002782861D|nr:hypothetical protein [Streptomyces sp. V4I2]MDQ1049132.1 hypothetical protein [Streptomyces sp. V4I2]